MVSKAHISVDWPENHYSAYVAEVGLVVQIWSHCLWWVGTDPSPVCVFGISGLQILLVLLSSCRQNKTGGTWPKKWAHCPPQSQGTAWRAFAARGSVRAPSWSLQAAAGSNIWRAATETSEQSRLRSLLSSFKAMQLEKLKSCLQLAWAPLQELWVELDLCPMLIGKEKQWRISACPLRDEVPSPGPHYNMPDPQGLGRKPQARMSRHWARPRRAQLSPRQGFHHIWANLI